MFGDGSVGGTLVVGGTVMGSGPYVDSSDARLKQNVRDLFSDDVTHRSLSVPSPQVDIVMGSPTAEEANSGSSSSKKSNTTSRLSTSTKLESAAIDAVRALRPVRYSFNASAAPNRSFPQGEEVSQTKTLHRAIFV